MSHVFKFYSIPFAAVYFVLLPTSPSTCSSKRDAPGPSAASAACRTCPHPFRCCRFAAVSQTPPTPIPLRLLPPPSLPTLSPTPEVLHPQSPRTTLRYACQHILRGMMHSFSMSPVILCRFTQALSLGWCFSLAIYYYLDANRSCDNPCQCILRDLYGILLGGRFSRPYTAAACAVLTTYVYPYVETC